MEDMYERFAICLTPKVVDCGVWVDGWVKCGMMRWYGHVMIIQEDYFEQISRDGQIERKVFGGKPAMRKIKDQ